MEADTKSKAGCPSDCGSLLAENKIENNTEEAISALASKLDTNKLDVKITHQLEMREDVRSDISCIGTNKKKRQHLCNTNLFPLRAAVILLYGGGISPGAFLSVFLKNRGMSLAGFSSVFSVTFMSQLLCASVSGIIADKMGNSKPVLIFNMTVTTVMIVSLLLIPNMKHDTCKKQAVNFSCFDELENLIHDSDNCSYVCFDNNKTFHPDKASTNNITCDNCVNSADCGNIAISYLLPKTVIENNSDEKSLLPFHSLNVSEYNDLSENCSLLCFNSQTNNHWNEKVLLIMYVFFTFSFLTFWTTTYRIIDVMIMSLVKEHGSSFGHERTFGMISEVTVAVMVGFGLDLFDSYSISQNKYDIVYWMCAVIMILAVFASCNVKEKIDPPGKQLTAKALKIVKNLDVFVFLVVMFISGSVHGFYWNFKLLFLEDLNAQKIVFGLNNACFSLCGIPGLVTSKWWLKTLGTSGIFLATFLSYAIYGFGYSFLYNPWLSLILEGTRGFFYNLFRVAMVHHSDDIAPVGLVSTVTAVSGAIHFAFGRSAGTFGGGFLMNATGQRTAYRLTAAGCLATSVMYIAFIFIRKKRRDS